MNPGFRCSSSSQLRRLAGRRLDAVDRNEGRMEERASERGGRQGEERADWAACRVQTGRTGRHRNRGGGKELGSLRLWTGRLATGTEEEERNQGAAATAHRNREGDLTLN